ncbi:MAG: RsmE family RNA methyltransferase [Dehalococcoidia bacterium]
MHRFYVPNPTDTVVTFNADQSRQIARVLRLRPGEQVEAFDGRGASLQVDLTAVSTSYVEGAVRATKTAPWPFPWRAILYLSLIRPRRFEWAVEKAAELGAWAIVPLLTERCTHGDATTSLARLARWQQIAVEAAEQCGSAFVPELRPIQRFGGALAQPAALRLFTCEREDPAREPLFRGMQALPSIASNMPPTIAIFIGPEGGFAPAEVEAARHAACTFITLGPQILRAETAAIAALAVLAQSSMVQSQ